MALKRVYLDQRDWIKLARQHHGVTQNNDIADVLALVREASTAGHASFPLSAAHYVETYHHREPSRRQRLGAFMSVTRPSGRSEFVSPSLATLSTLLTACATAA